MDKYQWMSGRFGTEDAFFMTAPDELHRLRRSALNPFFSKKKITEFRPVVQQKVDKLVYRITQFQERGAVIDWHKAMTAYAGDVISEYSFARSYDHLDSPDFRDNYYEPMHAACESGMLTLQFPWLWPLMNSLPDAVVLKLQPLLYLLINLQRVSATSTVESVAVSRQAVRH
jgi:cytochrome P450